MTIKGTRVLGRLSRIRGAGINHWLRPASLSRLRLRPLGIAVMVYPLIKTLELALVRGRGAV